MAQFIPFSNLIFPVISLLFNSSPLQSTQDKVLHRIFYIHIKVEYTAAQLIHRSPRPFNSIELFERSSIIWRNFRCRRRVASQFSLWRDYKRPVLTLVPAKCSFRYLRRRKILEPASIPTRVKTARCKPINRKGARSACITPPLR